jgi:DNA mismatch repair ATPase MutL
MEAGVSVRIRILPENLTNKIAACVVVEHPSQMAKEGLLADGLLKKS